MTGLAIAILLQAADLDALKARYEDQKALPPSQRLATITAIGELKTEAASALLEKIYEAEQDGAVRAQALSALSACGTETATKKLAAVAGDAKTGTTLRAIALRGAMRTKTKEGLAAARTVAREGSELSRQAYADLHQYALAETENLWREGLQSADAIVRGMALAALAPLNDPRLLDLARQALVNPAEEAPVKMGAVEVVRAAGGLANAKFLLSQAATPDPALRRRLGEALGSFTEDKSAAEIYGALRHADPVVRSVAARALGRLKHAQAWDKLAEPLKDRNAEVRGAALEAVAERKEKGSEALLLKEAQRADEDDAALAIGLLRGYPSDATRQILLKLAAHYKTGIAIPALEVLGDLRAPEAQPVFAKALVHKDWPVRVTAIRGLSRLAMRESVDSLVERMAKEDGRLLGECGDALRRLTGKTLGYSAAAWREWWAANRESFSFGEKGESPAGAPGMTTYHGVPVVSNRIVFCLDISGSMSEVGDKESRMEQAKKELSRVLSTLGKDVQANLVFFDDRIEPWKQQLVPVKANLPQALQIVGSLKPRGRTNIFDALALAFQHKEVDTVYLLSDGEPTDGRVVAPDDIHREIGKMNRLRQIVVHTISFGPSSFMKDLADRNGGHYVEIR